MRWWLMQATMNTCQLIWSHSYIILSIFLLLFFKRSFDEKRIDASDNEYMPINCKPFLNHSFSINSIVLQAFDWWEDDWCKRHWIHANQLQTIPKSFIQYSFYFSSSVQLMRWWLRQVTLNMCQLTSKCWWENLQQMTTHYKHWLNDSSSAETTGNNTLRALWQSGTVTLWYCGNLVSISQELARKYWASRFSVFLVCSRSLTPLTHVLCFARALRCIYSFARSLARSLPRLW